MQQAIPYKSWLPLYTTTKNPLLSSAPPLPPPLSVGVAQNPNLKGSKNTANLVRENPIIVFARRGCCMSHVVKRLLLGLGVNPPIFEVEEEDEISLMKDLGVISGNNGEISGNDGKSVSLPVVFIGGRLFGGLDRVMATHISGDLVPILKEAGALWL